MRVLVAAVSSSGTCSLGFAVALLRLQVALQTAPNMQAVVDFVPSVRAAAVAAKRDGAFDAVVAVSSTLSFPAGFVLRGIVTPAPFVAGVYPLPGIDWERVKARAGLGTEDMRFKGNTYNIDPERAKRCDVPGYMAVEAAGLGAVVLKGEAVEAVAGAAEGATDEAICAAWGEPILADLDHPCVNQGPMEFTGCVGFRTASAAAPGPKLR